MEKRTGQPAQNHAHAETSISLDSARYVAACSRVQTFQANEQGTTNPLCMTQLLSHGERTRQVIVLLHGYTNCPRQFYQLADLFHERGYNVLVPRLRIHGQPRRIPLNLGRMTADVLTAFGDEVVDIAGGLGEQVTVLGFSLGGLIAAWLAQYRREIDRGVIVAAPMGLTSVPARLESLNARVLTWLPDRFIWWSEELREQKPGPKHGYTGFSTRGVGEMLQLSLRVQSAARRHPPQAGKILVVTNENDAVVDNRQLMKLAWMWRKHGHFVRTYSFPKQDELIHDLMDPEQPEQNVAYAYPKLLKLVTEGWE